MGVAERHVARSGAHMSLKQSKYSLFSFMNLTSIDTYVDPFNELDGEIASLGEIFTRYSILVRTICTCFCEITCSMIRANLRPSFI
jgi:hypothetical protein